MKIPFNFDKKEIILDIPDKNLLATLEANSIKIEKSEAELVSDSIHKPIASDRLKDIVKKGEKIAIITSDITRPMPSSKVLPFVLEELEKAGIPDEDITIVFALGNHRPHTRDEMILLVGNTIFDRIRCVDSNGKMVHLGTTAMGTPVDIFEIVANADRRICLGNIEYHYFAGYSGGSKAIMPGVSTREAIQSNHSRMVEPTSKAGKIDGNAVRQDIDSVLNFISIDFIVNVVLNEHKQIVFCVSGDPVLAHREGCRFLDTLYGITIPQQADIAVVSPGGFPKDINLYQAQKALDNAKNAVKPGGAILWIASAKEGLGEKHFEEWMLGHDTPDEMISHIQSEFVLGGHKAAAIALVMKNAEIFLYSDLNADFVKRIHMNPVTDPQTTLNELIDRYGTEAKVVAMPFGGSTLPILKS